MNIFELAANTDTVKLNETLNPSIWTKHEHLKNAVKDQILLGVEEYCSYLGLSESQVKDVVISGENASFKYTNESTIDVVVVAELDSDSTFREFFNENKYKYNGQHRVEVDGHLVQFYVQPSDETFVDNGSYSVVRESWVNIPRRRIVEDTVSKLKALESAAQPKVIAPKVKAKIVKPQRITYGFRTPTLEDVGMSWDGVSPTTKQFASEDESQSDEDILKDFVEFCVKELKIKSMPVVKLRRDPQWSVRNKTFGRYIDDIRTLEVAFGQRHIMDVLRTVAHELTHKHQHERESMPDDAGETGSRYENEANARAGVLMRDYGRLHPELFDAGESDLGESASGYIPTKKQAKDPRWSMALTQDIKPGQLGKEANKLNLKTDSQGHPQIAKANGLFEKLALELNQFKRKGTLAESVEQLDEVRMAPSNLMQWATSDAAKGIRAGFEAELIFRDTNSGDDDDEDMEPDYDMDERCRSISQVVEFFQDDEWGYGLPERQASQLQDSLDERYMEWMDEQLYDSWRDERDELIRDAWLRDKPMGERIHAALVDGLDLTDEQADRIQAVGDKAPRFTKLSDQQAYEQQNKDYELYREAENIAEEILDEDVEQTIEKEDGFYDEVLDDFRSDFYVDDDSSFFSDVGMSYMSDVANEYDLGWPYLTGGAGNGGSRDWESIGDSLNDTIDMPVKVSSGYHSATRKEGLWIVEPDSSLEPDDTEDYGLEIVSPPMPLLTALEKLQEVTDWANDPSEGNAYTNSSTGLHMGVSVPFKGGDVDYLKLVLFLGDEYVLQQFGREANTYTKSAMSKFKENIKGGRTDPMSVIKLMQHGLLELAQREVQKGVGEGKYTSVHVQKGYIEFRSAGGDWLAEESADPEKLQNTMLRYARAMSLAANPAEERREYAKKLYKLIAPEGDSQLALFSQFAAGELTAEQLKKKWAEKTLSKEDPKAVEKGEWVVVNNSTGKPVEGQSYNGYTQNEVRARAKQKLSPASSDTDFDLSYSIKPQNTGRWEIYSFDLGADDENEQTLEIVDAPTRGAAADLVYDKYNDQKIPFKVRPYYGDQPTTPEKELSPRAKLAQRIVKSKQEPGTDTVDTYRGKWEFFYAPTGRVLDAVDDASIMQARAVLADTQRRYNDLPSDQIQMRKADAEQEPAVAQNFQQSTNPRPTAPISDQVRMPNGVPVWELYDKFSGTVLNAIADHTSRSAWAQGETWLRDHGAENPDTYTDRFDVRPKMLQPGERNLGENFADGRNPQDKGDSVRHGIPKGATIAELEKAAKAPGRKGELARWQLNMRRGKKK